MLDLQRASFGKRISAYLFDVILLFIAIVGIGCIVSAVVDYDGELDTLENMYQEYIDKYEIDMEKYETLSGKYGKYAVDKGEEGIVLEITDAEREQMTAAERTEFDEFEALLNLVQQADAEIEEDGKVAEQYSKIITLTVLIITISTLLSYLVLEFAVPIFIGNGQTLGKKIFSVAVMRVDGVKITTMQLFVRTILGKYTLETMIPVAIIAMMIVGAIGIIGPIVLLGIIIMEAVCYVKSETGSFIHDVVAATVCVDQSSQMIFETEEALVEYKEQLAEEAIRASKHTAEPLSHIYKRKDEPKEEPELPSEKISSLVFEPVYEKQEPVALSGSEAVQAESGAVEAENEAVEEENAAANSEAEE